VSGSLQASSFRLSLPDDLTNALRDAGGTCTVDLGKPRTFTITSVAGIVAVDGIITQTDFGKENQQYQGQRITMTYRPYDTRNGFDITWQP
jgi:hypothetical protein